jgi:ribose transport system substrate-binding protein
MPTIRTSRVAVLLAVVALALTGCATSAGGSTSATPTSKVALGPYCGAGCKSDLALKASQKSVNCKVAFLNDATSFPYGAAQAAKAQKYAKEYFPNMQLTVQNGNNDAATQSSQLDTVVAQGYKTVILDPVVSDALVPATSRAVKAGVKVVVIDRTVDTPVLSTIKAPDVPLAVRAAKHIATVLHGKGTVALLSGTPGASATVDRTKGFEQVMKNYPGIKVVSNVNGDYDANTSNTAVTNLLTKYGKGQINWIFSEADVMSLGAIKAIQAAGRTGDVKISGIDGQEEAFQAIQAGTYDSTVVYPVVQPAAVVAAAKVCSGESLPKSIPLLYPLVTNANVATYRNTNFK